jgi:hypothetical protein
MPGAIVAVGFGVIIQLFTGFGLKNDVTVSEIELIGFKLIIGVLNIKGQATTNGAFHFSILHSPFGFTRPQSVFLQRTHVPSP